MSDQDPVAWLRAQVEARRDLALLITEPRPHLRASGARLAGEWQTGCPCEAECGDYPACEEVTGDGIHIYSEGGHDADQAAHIAANDPQDTIARCEAELAILDEHRLVLADPGDSRTPYQITRDKPTPEQIGMVNLLHWIMACHACRQRVPCRTVRLLASGYRHRSGYEEAWKPDKQG